MPQNGRRRTETEYQENLQGNWSQSWERPSADDDRHITPAQWVLLVMDLLLLLALSAMGAYWVLALR